MGRILYRKGERGIATTYISRKQALKKLQLSLKDFRRLCILKGIYPVEPSHKKKANKNNSTNKTYYLLKDIQFLAHEPIIDKFRTYKVYVRRLRRAIGKQDQETGRRIRENEPTYKLDHIVLERYPKSFYALRELDDCLSLCFLFSTFPKGRVVKSELTQLCRRLTVEFLHYVMETRSLRKVFVSVKGIYYQAEISGEIITWMIPHALGYFQPSDVDFKIMTTFVHFYSNVLGFVNYKLYHNINLAYPPMLAIANTPGKDLLDGEEDSTEFVAALNFKLKSTAEGRVDDVEENQLDKFTETDEDSETKEEREKKLKELENLRNLFSGCKIYLNREVPKESLVFVIRSFGGEVSFDKTIFVGATFDEDDETITHQIVDRPNIDKNYMNRAYVQPQWIYDSVNARKLLPLELYFVGVKLPPHLSPFVEEKEGDYVPPEKKALLDYQKGISKTLNITNESDSAYVDESDSNPEDDDKIESSEDKSDESGSEEKEFKDIKSKTQGNGKKRKLEGESNVLPKMSVTPGKILKEDSVKIAQKEAAEEKQLAIMMMHKKDKHLYDKIVFSQKRKKREALKLKEKRESLDKAKRIKKK